MKLTRIIAVLLVLTGMSCATAQITETPEEDSILLYGRPGCGLCASMRGKLEAEGIEFSFLDIDESEEHRREMWSHVSTGFPGTTSVTLPVMVVNGTVLISPGIDEVLALSNPEQ